jgi:hypothetical protein
MGTRRRQAEQGDGDRREKNARLIAKPLNKRATREILFATKATKAAAAGARGMPGAAWCAGGGGAGHAGGSGRCQALPGVRPGAGDRGHRHSTTPAPVAAGARPGAVAGGGMSGDTEEQATPAGVVVRASRAVFHRPRIRPHRHPRGWRHGRTRGGGPHVAPRCADPSDARVGYSGQSAPHSQRLLRDGSDTASSSLKSSQDPNPVEAQRPSRRAPAGRVEPYNNSLALHLTPPNPPLERTAGNDAAAWSERPWCARGG